MTDNVLEILEHLARNNKKIMTIESMTGGNIIDTFTNYPGYSDYIYGGLIVYNTNAKKNLLGDPANSIYSEEYARQMCTDAMKTNQDPDIFVSITGNANPTNPELSDYSSEFFVCIASIGTDRSDPDKIIIESHKIMLTNVVINTLSYYTQQDMRNNDIHRRKAIKQLATTEIMKLLLKFITNNM